MRSRLALLVSSLTLAVAASALLASAQQQRRAEDVVTRAAEALGGVGRLRAVKTIAVAGYGETAYMNGGGNISASVDAPQKWISVPDYEKTIDLEHGRMRVRQRNHQNFVFAGVAGYLGGANAATASLDGDVAYNGAPNGRVVRADDQAARARRLDMMNNPVALVRAALDRPRGRRAICARSRRGSSPTSRSPTGETLTLAIDARTGLPAWVRWTGARREPGGRDVSHDVHGISARSKA